MNERNLISRAERALLTLSSESEQILVGLLLGDLFAQKRSLSGNALLRFGQGLVHEDYLRYLYEQFKGYCPSAPKISNSPSDKRTGKEYSRITFHTRALPCFNYWHDLFYLNGKKNSSREYQRATITLGPSLLVK